MSLGVKSKESSNSAFAITPTIFLWDKSAPFGRPVVPLV